MQLPAAAGSSCGSSPSCSPKGSMSGEKRRRRKPEKEKKEEEEEEEEENSKDGRREDYAKNIRIRDKKRTDAQRKSTGKRIN